VAGSGVDHRENVLKEIDFLCERRNWSYWDVYVLPVPVRRWFIRYIQGKEEKVNSSTPANDQPLTPMQKQKMIAQAQQASNNPGPPPGMLNSVRNKK
jgi:hypothetical protein